VFWRPAEHGAGRSAAQIQLGDQGPGGPTRQRNNRGKFGSRPSRAVRNRMANIRKTRLNGITTSGTNRHSTNRCGARGGIGVRNTRNSPHSPAPHGEIRGTNESRRSRPIIPGKIRRRRFPCLLKIAQVGDQSEARQPVASNATEPYLSDMEQAGLILACYAHRMTTVRHYPETSPEPTESSFPGYPLGVWPPIISSFCRENATYETRHSDCSLPGCTCPCHSRPR